MSSQRSAAGSRNATTDARAATENRRMPPTAIAPAPIASGLTFDGRRLAAVPVVPHASPRPVPEIVSREYPASGGHRPVLLLLDRLTLRRRSPHVSYPKWTPVKLHRTVAVSTALALFVTLSAAGAAVAAPAVDQTAHARQVASIVTPTTTTLTESEFASAGYTAAVSGFRAGQVTITLNGNSLDPVTLDPTGQFTFSYDNGGAGLAPGTYTFEFSQQSAGSQTAILVIVTDTVPTPTPTPPCSAVPAVITGSAPTSITITGIQTTGLPVTATGFIAGETVDVIFGAGQSATVVGQAVVGADCSVSYSLVVTTPLPAGTAYTVTLASDTAQISFPFAVVADVVTSPVAIVAPPAAAPRAAVRASSPQLAATGFEPAGGMLVAAGLLSAGAAAFALRRRLMLGRD
jgi:hypothetical protein